MDIRIFMDQQFDVLKDDQTIKEAVSILERTASNVIVVVDDHHQIIGVISDGDIFRALRAEYPEQTNFSAFLDYFTKKGELIDRIKDLLHKKVGDVMYKQHVITITEDMDIEELISIFGNQRFKEIPVVNKETGTVVGIVRRKNIIHYILEQVDILPHT